MFSSFFDKDYEHAERNDQLVILNDSIDAIAHMKSDSVDLIFADEPYNLGKDFGKGKDKWQTTQEYINWNKKWISEAMRVLKENGVCLVLSARKGVNISAPCIMEESEFEKDIWQRVEKFCSETFEKFEVCAYSQDEAELPLHMEKYGFRNVTTEYITVNLTPDNPIYSKEMAYAMINANRQGDLDRADSLLHIATGMITEAEVEELKRLVHEKTVGCRMLTIVCQRHS